MTVEEAIVVLELGQVVCSDKYKEAVNMVRKRIEKENDHGEWVWDGNSYFCSKCRASYGWWAYSQCTNFCPNCGADMRRVEE